MGSFEEKSESCIAEGANVLYENFRWLRSAKNEAQRTTRILPHPFHANHLKFSSSARKKGQ